MNEPEATDGSVSDETMRTVLEQIADARENALIGSLAAACEIGVDEGWGRPLSDIKRVEALWELNDGDASAYGFVVELHDGRRAYLSYCWHYDDGELVEHGEMLPMRRERLPH